MDDHGYSWIVIHGHGTNGWKWKDMEGQGWSLTFMDGQGRLWRGK